MSATDQTRVSPTKCAACAEVVNTPLFCDHCGTVAPLDGLDHFRALGLAARFDLDLDALRRSYFAASRRLHPDRARRDAGPDEGSLLRASARLNHAYQVLSDPLRRAEYLLELHGGESSLADRSVPQEVLTETLLLREELEETPADDQAARTALFERIDAGFARWLERVSDFARRLPGDEALRREMRHALNAIRYYQRMREQR